MRCGGRRLSCLEPRNSLPPISGPPGGGRCDRSGGRRTLLHRGPRHRKAAPPDGGGRDAGDYRPNPLLRRCVPRHRWPRVGRVPSRNRLIHPSRTSRCLRADHPLELPADDGRLEVGTRHLGRKYGRPQAVRAGTSLYGPHGRAPTGRLPERRDERDLRSRNDRPTPRAAPQSGSRIDHRQYACWPGSCSSGL